MKKHERGATLIIVLMILLLIMVVGTLAIRQSITSLKMVSNNQIQALLLQNSDAALMYFQNPNNVSKFAAANGIVGYYRNETNRNRELVFCFSGTDPFNLNNAAWLDDSLKTQPIATDGGPCTSSDVSGGRFQVITQIHIKRAVESTIPFNDLSRGTEVYGAKTENNIRLQVYVISVMSGLLSNEDKTLFKESSEPYQGCFTKNIQGLLDCLKNSNDNPLYNIQIAEYRFLSDFEPPSS